jgi:hypothetical protein
MTREIDGKGYVSFSSIEGIAEGMYSDRTRGCTSCISTSAFCSLNGTSAASG